MWCIEVCNVDIDIDLLFQEDLSIGKKISLTVSFLRIEPFRAEYFLNSERLHERFFVLYDFKVCNL